MNGLMKKVLLATALGATALSAAVPAEAQRYGRGGGYRGGYGGGYGRDNGGTAVVAGIAGLAIGAALASNRNDRYRDGYYQNRGYQPYYDDRYYRSHGYYPNDGYYAYQYNDRGYRGCHVERRYDPYDGRSVRVRICR